MKKVILFILLCVYSLSAAIAQVKPYTVYAIRFAESGYPFVIGDWAEGGPKDVPLKIDFSIWLIKGNGKNILVDAGFLEDIDDAKDFKLKTYKRPDSAVLNAGVRPADVTDIILSHPHWDHIDGLNLFPNAHIWIQQEDFNFFVGTAWQKGESNGGFAKRDVTLLTNLNLAGKVTLVNGDDQEILPGIRVYTGSKHTFNSQYVLVTTKDNKVLLASDNVWTYYSVEHMVPASAGGTLDPVGFVNAMKRMKTMVADQKYIIPGHDGDVYHRFRKISDGVVEIK